LDFDGHYSSCTKTDRQPEIAVVIETKQKEITMTTRFSKSILVLAAAALLSAGSVLAGNGSGPGNGDCSGTGDGTCTAEGGGNGGAQYRQGEAADRMARMTKRLGLTLQQQKAALDLFDAHAGERAKIREQIFEDYGEDICAQREQHRREFLDLLTPEQLALHEDMLRQREGRRGDDRNGFGGFECPDPEGD
jgi:hypothetical protein